MGAHTPVELQLLVVAVIIGFVQVGWAAAAGAGGERDFKYLAGPRDEPKPLGVTAARLDRALWNFIETFPLFAAAVLACVAAGKTGGTLSVYGAGVYVAARAVYVPLYAMGVPILRTLVYTAAMVGMIMVVVAFFR
jgi:uncharacterized MAPEG superfamily protein